MKFKTTISVIAFLTLMIVLSGSFFNKGTSRSAGADPGYCGSPLNLSTCASNSPCHGSTASAQAGWITSNIPASGYTPLSTYTITATATYAGRSKFGFEISPQNSSGVYLGNCIVTDTSTQLKIGTNSRRYMTHKLSGTTGTSGFHTWSFNWTAPAAGSGNLTFYGAFLCANGNNLSTGDITYTSTLPVTENITAIAEENMDPFHFIVAPNPVRDVMHISYKVEEAGTVTIRLIDLCGRCVSVLANGDKTPSAYAEDFTIPFALNPGLYFLEILTEKGQSTKKILVQQ